MRKVGLDVDQILLGSMWRYDGRRIGVEKEVTVFAKLSPDQKARIIYKSNRMDIVSAIWEIGSMMPLLWKWQMWGFLLVQQ